MKKRIFAMVLACMLLTACGAPAEEAAPVEQPTVEPVIPAVEAVPEEPSVEESEETPVPEGSNGAVGSEIFDEPEAPTVEDALAFVDQPLADMIAAIGEPLETYYEYSCSGPGDDGLLTYDGFIVFTYREPDGSAETVIDAEAE